MSLTGAIPKQSNSTVQIGTLPWLNLQRKPELDLLPLELDFLYGCAVIYFVIESVITCSPYFLPPSWPEITDSTGSLQLARMDVRKQPWGRGRPSPLVHSTLNVHLLTFEIGNGAGLARSLSLSPCAFAPFQDASLGLRSDALLKEALSKPRPRAEATLNPVRQQKIIGDRDPSVLGKRGPDQSWGPPIIFC